MFRRYRQRRGPYALAQPSRVPAFIRSVILLVIACSVLYFIGRGILGLFGFGSNQTLVPVTLAIENNSTVNASLEGGLMQRAYDGMKLSVEDKVSTSGNSHARLTFFDDSWIRTDSNTEVTIDNSSEDPKATSALALSLTKGAVWIDTPTTDTYSGAIVRTIHTSMFTLDIPADAQVAVMDNSLLVFSADGNGVGVTLKNAKEPVYIGEGQQLILPSEPSGTITKYRSAIDPLVAQKPFITQSRAMARAGSSTASGSGTVVQIDANAITITSPSDNSTVESDVVTVSGKIGANIDRVRVNGHLATINRTAMTYSVELAMTDAPTTSLQIEALDANDIVLDQLNRTVKRAAISVNTPTITSPAKNGQTYRTQDTQIDIKGTALPTTAGIMVNDYKLQLFRKGDTTWSYLASKQLSNLVDGKNVFNVYALDDEGNPSAPATVTVLIEAGPVGLVSTGSTVGSTSSAAPTIIDEKTLPQNAPTMPGTITVTGPAAGSSFTATGSEILIEGTVPTQTASVWVNGYKLQLYKAGKTIWNYIAKTDYGTLKRGTNVYKINARDKNDQILDSFTYTVQFNP